MDDVHASAVGLGMARSRKGSGVEKKGSGNRSVRVQEQEYRSGSIAGAVPRSINARNECQ